MKNNNYKIRHYFIFLISVLGLIKFSDADDHFYLKDGLKMPIIKEDGSKECPEWHIMDDIDKYCIATCPK